MRTKIISISILSLLLACAADDGGGGDDGAAMTDGSDGTTGPEPPPDESSGTTDDDPMATDGEDDPFVFDDSPPSDYTQIDRMGMPAINTAVISSKDAYNADTPASDAAGTYVPEIGENLTGLHDALDDDLEGLGLVPCELEACVNQAAPLVVPDTLKIDLTAPAGFPNGRGLADPVIDVTLAVILLDLGVDGQDATTLAGVPVNPPANDVGFTASFPYLADPN